MKTIPLTHGAVALIDDEDYERVSQHKWFVSVGPYASYAKRWASKDCPDAQMHRLILNAQPGQCVDHINRDGLDNQKSNLRYATKSQNSCNKVMRIHRKGKLKGIIWKTANKKWEAHIKHHQHQIYLGLYETKEQAARAYDRKAAELFGEFARPNFSTEDTR